MSNNAVEPIADPLWESDGYVLKDRAGYTVDPYNLNTAGASPYFVVHRESDGTGIGAFGSDKAVDDAIAADREWVASNQPRTGGAGDTVVTEPIGTAPDKPTPSTIKL